MPNVAPDHVDAPNTVHRLEVRPGSPVIALNERPHTT